MIRRPLLVLMALALAGCAATPPARPSVPPPPPAPAPAVPIPPAPPSGEPAGFLNLPASGLRTMLGAPQFVRRDGAMALWRYDGAACRVFFFLYGPDAGATVRHVETLPAGRTSAADPACLAALKRAKPAS